MGQVTMYGADWCRDCRQAKAYLDNHNVSYSYVDLEQRPDEMERVIEYNNGRTSIPVVVFADGTHLTEPSDAELAVKLGHSTA